MLKIESLDARLAYDVSTKQSLFTGVFTGVQEIKMTLAPIATGTAHFAIFDNNREVVSKNVKKGESITYSPKLDSKVAFYVNSYDGKDLAQAHVAIAS